MRRRAFRYRGLNPVERWAMDSLARAACMVAQGFDGFSNYYVADAERLTISWRGTCRFSNAWCIASDRQLQWAHLIGRGRWPNGLWMRENAIGLCGACHNRMDGRWQTSLVPVDRDIVSRVIGAERIEMLEQRRRRPKETPADQRAALEDYLRANSPGTFGDILEFERLRAAKEVKRDES